MFTRKKCYSTFSICTAALLLIMWVGVICNAATDNDLAELVKLGSKQAITNVTSGQGSVIIHFWRSEGGSAAVETECVYKLAFKGDKYRLSIDGKIIQNDKIPERPDSHPVPVGNMTHQEVAIDGFQITHLTNGKATVGDGSIRGSYSKTKYYDYMSDFSLQAFTATGNGLIDIDAMERSFKPPLYTSTSLKVIGREIINDSECIVLELVASGASNATANRIIDLWIDPQKGFVLPKARAFYEGGPYTERTLSHESIAEFKEYQAGVWYPTKVTRNHYKKADGGELRKFRTVTLTYDPEFQLNTVIDDKNLTLPLPAKTQVHNELLDAFYTIP